ncbi:MAG: hypothetical protein ABIA76_03990, partial [Candidatus Diapherotrites archaeon]
MKLLPNEKVIFKKSSIVWPLLLLPYYENSHTTVFLGFRNKKIRSIKDIKFSQGFSTVYLTNKRIYCEFLFPKIFLFEIKLTGIKKVNLNEKDHWLLEIEFTECSKGSILKSFA